MMSCPAMHQLPRNACLQAKSAHPKMCNDVGTAALRDLGCDNYNEGYNPTTVYMGADGAVLMFSFCCVIGQLDPCGRPAGLHTGKAAPLAALRI